MKVNAILGLLTLLTLVSCGRVRDDTVHTIDLSIQNHSETSLFFTINKKGNQDGVDSADSIDFTPLEPGQTVQRDFHFVPGEYSVLTIDNPSSTQGVMRLEFRLYDANKTELLRTWGETTFDRDPTSEWTNYYYDISFKTKYPRAEYESIINSISDDADKQAFASHFSIDSSGKNYQIRSSSGDIQVSNLEVWDRDFFGPIFEEYGIPISRNRILVDYQNWQE